ncbi:MAG: methyltransferase [Prevotellaceae bacterium]|nr:methyltransferase [Prevotellaceae bacterium]
MAKTINNFNFKQFSIIQQQSAMKVGTDGVLLGAWCAAENAESALDIGCGTGLIALMLAQRNPNLQIDAVEIDENSAEEAKINVKNSKWGDRISVFCQDITSFRALSEKSTENQEIPACAGMTEKGYDLIVSNPPFFENSLKSPNSQRTAARHNDNLTLQQLAKIAAENLTENGYFSVVLPAEQTENFILFCQTNNLFLARQTNIFTTPNSAVRRVLLEFSKQNISLKINDLTIEYSSNNFTEEYKNLTKDFYLKF